MNLLNKKVFLKVILMISPFLIVGYLCITLFVNYKFYHVKKAVLEHNPEITSIESIAQLGGWEEFFLEYVLVVKKGIDTKYRIWTYGDGEITGEEIVKNKFS